MRVVMMRGRVVCMMVCGWRAPHFAPCVEAAARLLWKLGTTSPRDAAASAVQGGVFLEDHLAAASALVVVHLENKLGAHTSRVPQ